MVDGNLSAREMQRRYLREWRKKNPDKVKKYNRDYWRRKAEKAKQEGANEHD